MCFLKMETFWAKNELVGPGALDQRRALKEKFFLTIFKMLCNLDRNLAPNYRGWPERGTLWPLCVNRIKMMQILQKIPNISKMSKMHHN